MDHAPSPPPMLDDNPFGITATAAKIPVSKHVMGTARMGDDPATSVCDRWGRLHDVPNVTHRRLVSCSRPAPATAPP